MFHITTLDLQDKDQDQDHSTEDQDQDQDRLFGIRLMVFSKFFAGWGRGASLSDRSLRPDGGHGRIASWIRQCICVMVNEYVLEIQTGIDNFRFSYIHTYTLYPQKVSQMFFWFNFKNCPQISVKFDM